MRNDAALVRAVLAGDRGAYGVLYDRHAPLVRALCYDVTRNLAEAQDLAQDVFLRAFVKLAELRAPEDFAAWVVGIARLRCREWQRGSWRDFRLRRPLDEEGLSAASPPDLVALHDLHATIASLPARQRLAIRLFYLQEQPVEVAQAVMGISRSGFYRLLELGRSRLRQLLECAGGIHGPRG